MVAGFTLRLRRLAGSQGSSEQFQLSWERRVATGRILVGQRGGTNVNYTAGNVGVGTASPQQSLSVVGGPEH